ncbi:hypothetical protein E2C01_099530 [Portunus trituberculatus]|uniref:Uncharacterized protein n=1 Tax=Portunus trituberculatus TaxID=210409 RepID=A0A5B7KB03_PORTR|nr:hypothetical protein [Portunus trituberculatus]
MPCSPLRITFKGHSGVFLVNDKAMDGRTCWHASGSSKYTSY